MRLTPALLRTSALLGTTALLGTLFLCLGVTGDEGSTWTALVPSSVPGLLGSCLVVPCSFDFPPIDPQKNPQFTGMWLDAEERIACHPNRSKVAGAYRDRVQLLGTPSRKNCSVVIDPVRKGDHGHFHFRIEIKHFNNYSFKEKAVSVAVRTAAEPLAFQVTSPDFKVGSIVSAFCAVNHTCPSSPPTFTWTQAGHQTTEAHRLADGQWQAKSWLGFGLTLDLHNTTLGCRVDYKGGIGSRRSMVLLVKHPPLNVEVQQPREALEGGEAELLCVSDGHPPVRQYWWVSEAGEVVHRGQSYLLLNASRHHQRLCCSATNALGQARSALVRVNTTYPPEVSPASGCFSSTLSCECVVEASPPAEVSLSGADDAPLSAAMETQGSVTVATLLGGWPGLWSSDHIHCHASNSLGNTTHTLQVPRGGRALMISGIATGALLLILMMAFGIKWKRGRTRALAGVARRPSPCPKESEAIYANM